MPFLTEADKTALAEAVAALERRSTAEVVVVVRAQSGCYRHADLLAGVAAGAFVLWFLLYSPWPFALASILFGPLLAGAVVAALSSRSPLARRLFTREAERRAAVATHARAAFVESQVHHTRTRTGILLYVSLLERRLEVVADAGVREAVPALAWSERVAALQRVVEERRPGAVLAAKLEELGQVLASALPPGAAAVNELPDEVVA